MISKEISETGLVGLLPYTELTKDYIKDVFEVHQTGDLDYRLGGIS